MSSSGPCDRERSEVLSIGFLGSILRNIRVMYNENYEVMSDITCLCLAGNEGMDPHSSPHITYYSSFRVLFRSRIPS